MSPHTIIFHGRSGCGKSTQAQMLKSFLETDDNERKILLIQTGDQFRELAKSDTYTGRLVKKTLDEGGLFTEFLPIWIWTGILVNNLNGNEDLLFDGLVRRLVEAHVLDGAFSFYKREQPTLLFLNVSREWSFKRLKERGRHDDTDEDIQKRLEWYEDEVVQALNFFRNNPGYRFLEINGEQPAEAVHQNILKAIGLVG